MQEKDKKPQPAVIFNAVTFEEVSEQKKYEEEVKQIYSVFLPKANIQSIGTTEDTIYCPSGRDENRFMTKKEQNSNKPSSQITIGVQLYHALVNKVKLWIYEEDFYVFSVKEGIYRKMTDAEMNRLINYHYGKIIEENGGFPIYLDICNYLKVDCKLALTKERQLPLNLWAFRNGLVDVWTGKVTENTGQYFVRNVLNANYNYLAECPMFEKYLGSIAGNDANIRKLLWQVVGYLLSRDTRAKVFFVCIGPKDTGKSLFARVLTEIIGIDSVSFLSAKDFSGRFDVGEIRDKQMNVCMDLPQGAWNVETVGKIKAITGNDIIRSDVKYKESIRFKPSVRLLFGTNHPIGINYPDEAFKERMVIIPFTVRVPKEQQDRDLEKKLLLEKDGIVVQAMKHYLNLVLAKYKFVRVEQEVQELDYQKVLKVFSQEVCIFTESEDDKISSKDLYEAFRTFCLKEKVPVLELGEFSRKFNQLFSNKVGKKKIKINNESLQGFTKIKFRN